MITLCLNPSNISSLHAQVAFQKMLLLLDRTTRPRRLMKVGKIDFCEVFRVIIEFLTARVCSSVPSVIIFISPSEP
jgi:hypothetical protein